MLAFLQNTLLLAFPALVIIAAMRDASSYTIPNWISLALIAAFFPAAFAWGLPAAVIGQQAGICLIALVMGVTMFGLGWIGGGDAKLFAAAALWLGWPAFITYVLVTAVAGGGLAVSLLGLRSMWMQPYVQGVPSWFGRLATPGENVPYGVAIGVGALTAFPACALMQWIPALG